MLRFRLPLASLALSLLLLAACNQFDTPVASPISSAGPGADTDTGSVGVLGSRYGEPVPESLIVGQNGLEWVWASAVAHNGTLFNETILLGHEGFGFATQEQWDARPPTSAFVDKCAAAYFSSYGDSCNPTNLADSGEFSNAYGSAPAGGQPTAQGTAMVDWWDTLLVRGELEPETDLYTLDFDTAPTNRLTFAVQVGNGMTFTGSGDPSPYGVQVSGKRIVNNKVRRGNQARVISQDGDKVLTVVSQGTSTPNPQGGVLEFKPHAKFGAPSAGGNNGLVTVKSLTIHNVTTSGVVVLCGNGSCGKPTKLERGAVQTLTFDQADVGTIRIRVNNAFSVDDVVLEVPATPIP